jgi:hypothetical protein
MARPRNGVNQFFRDKDSHGSCSFSADRNPVAGAYTRPHRLTASALTVRDLPKIDIVLLSHAHFDRFDMRTLHRFHRSTTVITAQRTSDLLRWTRFRDVSELRWKESLYQLPPPRSAKRESACRAFAGLALTLSTKAAVAWLLKMIEASKGALTARRPAGPS